MYGSEKVKRGDHLHDIYTPESDVFRSTINPHLLASLMYSLSKLNPLTAGAAYIRVFIF